jgi:hypothetical protein
MGNGLCFDEGQVGLLFFRPEQGRARDAGQRERPRERDTRLVADHAKLVEVADELDHLGAASGLNASTVPCIG